MAEGWMSNAACKGLGPNMFFQNERNSSDAEARAICGECPVLFQCWAAGNAGNESGIWGGMNERERRAQRRRLARLVIK